MTTGYVLLDFRLNPFPNRTYSMVVEMKKLFLTEILNWKNNNNIFLDDIHSMFEHILFYLFIGKERWMLGNNKMCSKAYMHHPFGTVIQLHFAYLFKSALSSHSVAGVSLHCPPRSAYDLYCRINNFLYVIYHEMLN